MGRDSARWSIMLKALFWFAVLLRLACTMCAIDLLQTSVPFLSYLAAGQLSDFALSAASPSTPSPVLIA